MSSGIPKELRRLIQQAETQGWVVTKNRSSHLRWKSPDGASVFTASTPSDWRVIQNIVRDLKRYGFIAPRK